jgi:hypothetical protein
MAEARSEHPKLRKAAQVLIRESPAARNFPNLTVSYDDLWMQLGEADQKLCEIPHKVLLPLCGKPHKC